MAFSKLFCFALVTFLAAEVSSQKPVSLKFTKSTSLKQSGIILQGDATRASNGVISLTTHTGLSTGPALFANSVRIWDKSTDRVANIITSFTFVVSDIAGYIPGDGLIFFLGRPNTQIPNNSTGGKLGVVDGSSAFNQFVGIEFDTHVNEWDPDYVHVGIDVGTLISLKTVRWPRVSGLTVIVNIHYAASSQIFFAEVRDAAPGGRFVTISQVVDFKAVLPEVVSVGLSATTNGGRETHDINYWDFTTVWNNVDQTNLASYAA